MGSPIALVGQSTAGGGVVVGGGQSSVFANGKLVAVLGDAIASHGPPPHASAVITGSSGTVFAGGIAVARDGDSASCGDSLINGSSNVNAG